MWLDLTFVAVLSVNLKFILFLGYKLSVHFRLLTVTNIILLNVIMFVRGSSTIQLKMKSRILIS